MDYPPVYVLITTYERTEIALRTIRAIKEKLIYPNYGWYISDDGSREGHLSRLTEEIGQTQNLYLYNSQRKGVGHGMNHCLKHLFEMGINHVLLLEDDWELNQPFDLIPYVDILTQCEDIGYVRLGYLSEGLRGELIARAGKLYWHLYQGQQYNYTGHGGLRHKRLHDRVGLFSEGLAPGYNELDFIGKYNATQNAPKIVWPAEIGCWGVFSHIGGQSLKDIKPE